MEFVGNSYGVDISTVQWKDTKNVRLASTCVGVLPFLSSVPEKPPSKAVRYDRKNKRYLELDCPHIIKGIHAPFVYNFVSILISLLIFKIRI